MRTRGVRPTHPLDALLAARGALFPWVPVFLAVGIGIYFALPEEPGAPAVAAVLAGLAAAVALWLRGPVRWQPVAVAAGCVLAGTLLAGLRSHMVAAPVLGWHYHGPVQGRVVAIDRSASDAVRLLLDRVVLARVDPKDVPARIRISLVGPRPDRKAAPPGAVGASGSAAGRPGADRRSAPPPFPTPSQKRTAGPAGKTAETSTTTSPPSSARTPARMAPFDADLPLPGATVMLTGYLGPPARPAEPGGFDFRRYAWFAGIGAVGYSRTPLMVWEPAPPAAGLARLRTALARAIREAVPGPPGAFAAAVATGDRAAIGQATLEDLRAANTAHLLAISGLHMGLLTGLVFGALRFLIAAAGPLALRVDGKKMAAAGALAAAGSYLALSGGNVATQRAFVMVAVMLVAVLLDRRALTLRSVALAATIILVLRPESLTGAGFQMSFAATVALVAGFAALRDRGWLGRLPKWARAPAGLVLSSFIAGMATMPVAAAGFHRIAEYGLVANLLSVPAMGLVVMPAVIAAAVLAPFGLAAPALWLMGAGARWILGVSHWVAGLDGAVRMVMAPPGAVLPLMALGALWLVLWPGRTRWLGMAPVVAALLWWNVAARPALLVTGDGRLAGLMGPEGRVLSNPAAAARYVPRNWLSADGDGADPAEVAARTGFTGRRGAQSFWLGAVRGVLLGGRGAAGKVARACDEARLVILSLRYRARPPADCLVIDATALSRHGALAIDPDPAAPGGLRIRSAARVAGRRPWTGRVPPPARALTLPPDPGPDRRGRAQAPDRPPPSKARPSSDVLALSSAIGN